MTPFRNIRVSAGGWHPPPWIARNMRVKVLAMVLALASWVVVVYAANPPDSRQILVHVQQDAQQLPGRYVLAHPIADIAVRINGTREHVDAFQASSVRATPNFDAIRRTGVQQLPLTVVSTDPNLDLSDVPSTVSADVDLLGTTTVPVVVRPSKTQVGFRIKELTATPDHVQIIGPQRELGVAQAVVDFNFGTRTQSLTQDGLPVIVIDPRSGDRPLPDVTVTPATVRVKVIIEPVDGTVVSTVVPQVIGTVAPGYRLTGVVADPATVTLSGTENLLNGFLQIPTPQVSISGLTSDRIFTVIIDAPQGLSFRLANEQLAGSQTINVHVSVATLPDAVITPSAPTPAPSPTPRSTSAPTATPGCRQPALGTPPCPSPTP